MRAVVVIAVLVASAAACSSSNKGRKVRVAAASDLGRAFEEVARAFQTKTGITPEITFGSSGLLSKQIEQGAPYYLFASANKSFVTNVVDAKRCDGATRALYARGRIVLWSNSNVTAPKRFEDVADPRFKRIAIANPDHAPYGIAAKQALQKADLWSKVEDRIVLGENIQATMLFARDGNADAAIVALSLAVVADGGAFVPIDQSLHEPLDQQLVVCGTGEEAEAAKKLAAYIESPEGREIMTRYGFLLPGEHGPGK